MQVYYNKDGQQLQINHICWGMGITSLHNVILSLNFIESFILPADHLGMCHGG